MSCELRARTSDEFAVIFNFFDSWDLKPNRFCFCHCTSHRAACVFSIGIYFVSGGNISKSLSKKLLRLRIFHDKVTSDAIVFFFFLLHDTNFLLSRRRARELELFCLSIYWSMHILLHGLNNFKMSHWRCFEISTDLLEGKARRFRTRLDPFTRASGIKQFFDDSLSITFHYELIFIIAALESFPNCSGSRLDTIISARRFLIKFLFRCVSRRRRVKVSRPRK